LHDSHLRSLGNAPALSSHYPRLALFLRLGVTAMIVAMATLTLLATLPRGLDFSAWHQDPGRVAALLVLALAAYGFHTALAGRRVFSGEALS
jgi:hypothetical protein